CDEDRRAGHQFAARPRALDRAGHALPAPPRPCGTRSRARAVAWAHRAQRRPVARARTRAARLRLGTGGERRMSAAPRFAADHAAVAESLPAAIVTRAAREAALGAALAHGLPVNRNENWHYANLR